MAETLASVQLEFESIAGNIVTQEFTEFFHLLYPSIDPALITATKKSLCQSILDKDHYLQQICKPIRQRIVDEIKSMFGPNIEGLVLTGIEEDIRSHIMEIQNSLD